MIGFSSENLRFGFQLPSSKSNPGVNSSRAYLRAHSHRQRSATHFKKLLRDDQVPSGVGYLIMEVIQETIYGALLPALSDINIVHPL